jgi:hypothetical protein
MKTGASNLDQVSRKQIKKEITRRDNMLLAIKRLGGTVLVSACSPWVFLVIYGALLSSATTRE